MTQKFCPACGTKAPSMSAKFCTQCGSNLDPFAQKTIVTAKRKPKSSFDDDDDEEGTEILDVPRISELKVSVDGFAGAHSNEGSFGGASSFSFTPNGFSPTRVQRINK